jgi:hypothetical protein
MRMIIKGFLKCVVNIAQSNARNDAFPPSGKIRYLNFRFFLLEFGALYCVLIPQFFPLSAIYDFQMHLLSTQSEFYYEILASNLEKFGSFGGGESTMILAAMPYSQ